MNSKLIDAMTMRDGGTTYVVVHRENGDRIRYVFRYSLPWDGRARYISVLENNVGPVDLVIGSREESEACECVRALLVEEYGEDSVLAFERGAVGNIGKGIWFYAFNFLRLALQEGKIRGKHLPSP